MQRIWMRRRLSQALSKVELQSFILNIANGPINRTIQNECKITFHLNELTLRKLVFNTVNFDYSRPIATHCLTYNFKQQQYSQDCQLQFNTMNNLKYRVYSVSTQNDEFPAQNIQDMSGIWETQQNCAYPQQLTVQFYVPIQTKNMKIMFHQYKIPKLIQVFVRCGKQQKYRKLGLIQPNDNSQSNYLQKQIKTIFFQFPCSFVKLIFHQNYRNQMNLFDQIAICQLSFEGEVLPSSQYKNLDLNILDSLDTSSDEQSQKKTSNQLSQVQAQVPAQKKLASTFCSVMFPELFQKLEQKKRQAVERQQFQKAAYIKNSLANFEELQKQILKFEELKKIALDEQDYDRCHKLKIEINKKKEMLGYQIKEFQDKINEQQNILTFSRANNQVQKNSSNFVTHRQKKNEAQELSQRTPVGNKNMPSNFQEYDSQVVPALRNKKNVQEQYMTVGKANQSILDALRNPTTDKKQDPQVEESLDYNSYDVNKILIEFPELEQLQFKNFKKYEPFFDYIRIDLWRMFLSEKYWKVKSIALNQIMGLQVTQGKHLIAIMEAVAITICDKHTVNIKKSLQLLEKLVNMPNKDIWCDANHPRFFVDTILTTLIQLMNDTKEQFRKMAVQIYKNLPEFSLIYLETAIKNIIKSSSAQFSKNKRKSNPRLQQAKLAVIQYYLSTFTDVMHHLNQIIKWLAECANDPSSEVKMTATQMLLQIARMDKELFQKVKQQLVKQGADVWAMFQPQYQALITQIESSKVIDNLIDTPNDESIDIYKRETMKNKNRNSSRITSQRGNESSFNSGLRNKQSEEVQLAYSQESVQNDRSHEWFANTDQRQIKVMEPTEQQLQGLCDYCYRKYPEKDYNEHLRNNCCVVVPCIYCGGVIYLREMTEHLLTGCEKKHQQCQRCMLAFQFDEINEHVARKICRKSRTHMQRCPYCEQDIQADDLSWVQHAEKCTRIIRPSPNRTQMSENEEAD